MAPANGFPRQNDLQAMVIEGSEVVLHTLHVQTNVGTLAQVDRQQLRAIQLQAVHVAAPKHVEELEGHSLQGHLRDAPTLLQVQVRDVGTAVQRHLKHVVAHAAAVQHHRASQWRAQ